MTNRHLVLMIDCGKVHEMRFIRYHHFGII